MEVGTPLKPLNAPPKVADAPADGARTIVIRKSRGLGLHRLPEVWEFRELLFFIAWRDVKIRYKQTFFGAAWAVIQPLALMLVFWLFAGKLLHSPSQGFPYPVFVFAGLLPWNLFSQSLTAASNSMITNAQLVAKVYFPRLILPVGAIGPFLFDFAIGSCVLFVMMAITSVTPHPQIVLFPFFGLLAILAAIAVGVGLSAVNARYRDVQAALPLMIQIWLFLSPIVYPITLVPEQWRAVYALNPMVAVIGGVRWTLLGAPAPEPKVLAASILSTICILIVSVVYFQRTERTFADVI